MANYQIGVAVSFHDALHGFWAGQGKGTASLEDNLIQKLIEIREEVLYKVLINPQNSYSNLCRDIFLDILVGYRIGPRTERVHWIH